MFDIGVLMSQLQSDIASIELRMCQGFNNPAKERVFQKRRDDLCITLSTIKEYVRNVERKF